MSTVYQERINLIKLEILIVFVRDVVSWLKEYIYIDKKCRAFTEINNLQKTSSSELFNGNQ
jgi:hypothetical protein